MPWPAPRTNTSTRQEKAPCESDPRRAIMLSPSARYEQSINCRSLIAACCNHCKVLWQLNTRDHNLIYWRPPPQQRGSQDAQQSEQQDVGVHITERLGQETIQLTLGLADCSLSHVQHAHSHNHDAYACVCAVYVRVVRACQRVCSARLDKQDTDKKRTQTQTDRYTDKTDKQTDGKTELG